ncbi:hypothetical protein ANANG_G00228610 [Anguilla anguilla]|uniref:Secreted protein n=1 Tax=Anguilla anguilla TaxID=7936 RepID=A0A9D3RTF2_ANGAN|nr:hypothetical protein ANANG_G00228610 [Anguilla anguilla]
MNLTPRPSKLPASLLFLLTSLSSRPRTTARSLLKGTQLIVFLSRTVQHRAQPGPPPHLYLTLGPRTAAGPQRDTCRRARRQGLY